MLQRLLLVFFGVVFAIVFGHTSVAQPTITIRDAKSSKVSESFNTRLNKSVSFIVCTTDSAGAPIVGSKIVSTIISGPGGYGATFSHDSLKTNRRGEALITFLPAKGDGRYLIKIYAEYKIRQTAAVVQVDVKERRWVWLLFVGLVGGLAFFFLGLEMLSNGLKKLSGGRMRTMLTTLTKNRIMGAGLGSLLTMIFQSSTATSVMLVSLVESKLMQFRQTIAILLGAALGTSLTMQLIAFKITSYSLFFVAIGFIITLIGKKQKTKNIGSAILGFGILFFGMDLMATSMAPLRTFEPFIDILSRFQNPILGILAGTIFTALLQSSAAFIGIVITLASQGLISLEASIPLMLGANIGSTVTAIIASAKGGSQAKQVAWSNAIFKIFWVLIVVWIIPQFVNLVYYISPSPEGNVDALMQVVPRQIANAHTIYNVIILILTLPFIDPFARLVERLFPPKVEHVKTMYLEKSLMATPSLALLGAKKEVILVAHQIQDMLNDIILPFFTKEDMLLPQITAAEKQLDKITRAINSFLVELTRQEVNEEEIQEAYLIMYTNNELEQIAELIANNMVNRAAAWIESDHEFSDEGKRELMLYHLQTQKQLSRAIAVFKDFNLEKTKHAEQKYKKFRMQAIELEKQHYQRLKEDVEKSVTSSRTHLELVSSLRVIGSHATNIVRTHLPNLKDDLAAVKAMEGTP
ncbi:Na/Pi symporter [Williamwhitmania taraxaci]|uniref:Phosphate:Na+ symporter n=1 Tax=Williamwhitmania taraxaci TaxID=1640674 RepID=A0A1G6JW99_9BACT|nr:Na/Pi symporter [Williamwhitmania taraxaci]SDC22994.1 phosphate:Na+ symporter [Williamwhitmania taraxaci]